MMTDLSKTVDASPTKDFFIRMLVMDAPLIKVIPDLVDNCVDGARRIRPGQDFTDLWVRIEVNESRFRIADNCGGISVELAREYAFRFGRDKDMPAELQVPHSTGRFGIGMKRALFKMGREFRIESTTERTHFVIEEDVERWEEKEEEKWSFEFKEMDENLPESAPPDKRRTIIEVTSLHESVAEDFALDNFQSRLKADLEARQRDSIDKGLAITLNGIPLQLRVLQLLQSEALKPGYQELSFQPEGRPEVRVQVYAGISKSVPADCGWHIFCNGRLILEADKGRTTGWGDGNPRYHPQYNRFRGFAFFDSDDATGLPWKTTKDGVDADSPVFRKARLKMIEMMRPVINFLNDLDAEKDLPDGSERALEAAVEAAPLVELAEIQTEPTFLVRPKPAPRQPAMTTISYLRPKEKVERVKEVLEARSNKQVGEYTFDYFFEAECED